MGTSRGISTPSGGQWTNAKREINTNLDSIATSPSSPVSPEESTAVVHSVVQAIGGLGFGIPSGTSSGRVGGTGAGGGRTRPTGGGGGRGRASALKSRAVGKSVAGLGGFATAVRDAGLSQALRDLDLSDLEGRSAVEVIARVSERLAEGTEGVDSDLLRTALNDTILEAAQLDEELAYSDLEAGLQSFLNTQGLAGLISTFLAKLVTDLVTASVFQHVDERAENANQLEAFLSGIESVCRSKASETVDQFQADGRLNRTDWFGNAGARLGRDIAEKLLSELGATS